MNKLLLFGLFLLAPVSIASADLKVAVIDLGKAFDSYYKTQEAQARIKEKEEAAQKDLSDLATEYEHMQEDAQKLYDDSNNPSFSPQTRQDKATALKQKQQDILAMQNKLQETKVEREREIQEEVMSRHKDILEEITKVVDDYSSTQDFDLVFDKSGASAASGLPVVLYSSNRLIDITTEIIRRLNLTAPAATGVAPSGATTPMPSTNPLPASP